MLTALPKLVEKAPHEDLKWNEKDQNYDTSETRTSQILPHDDHNYHRLDRSDNDISESPANFCKSLNIVRDDIGNFSYACNFERRIGHSQEFFVN